MAKISLLTLIATVCIHVIFDIKIFKVQFEFVSCLRRPNIHINMIVSNHKNAQVVYGT